MGRPRGRSKYAGKFPVGHKFGDWTVLDTNPVFDDKGRPKLKVQCKCGIELEAEVRNLIKGTSTQCRTCAGHGSPTFVRGTPAGEVPASYVSRIKHSAESRGLVNTLSPTYLSESFSNTCALSGLSIGFDVKNASLDRVSSDKGYTEENTQWVHKAVNEMKGNLPNEVFIAMCHQVADHNPNPVDVDLSPIEKTAVQRSKETLTDFFDRRENQ